MPVHKWGPGVVTGAPGWMANSEFLPQLSALRGKMGKIKFSGKISMPVKTMNTELCANLSHICFSLAVQPSTHSLIRMCKYVCSLGNPQFTKEFSFLFFLNMNFISQYLSVPGFPFGSFCNFTLFSGCTNQGLNLGHSHEKPRILTSRPPGNSPEGFLLKLAYKALVRTQSFSQRSNVVNRR